MVAIYKKLMKISLTKFRGSKTNFFVGSILLVAFFLENYFSYIKRVGKKKLNILMKILFNKILW